MTAADQLVDITADPLDIKRRRRRAVLRIGVPIAGLILVIAAILGIALYADQANRKGALALSNDVLTTLDGRIRQQVLAFLEPGARALRIIRGMTKDGAFDDRRPVAESLSVSVLKEVSQIANINFADSNGNFMMVRRAGGNRIDIKEIDNRPDARRVTWIHRDDQGHELSRNEDSTDNYDPRTRPWYDGAKSIDTVFWTGLYIFFTDRKPGLTASQRYLTPDGRLYVVGVDIQLHELSHFLASLRIGQHGRALLIDGDGHLIAFPDQNRMQHLIGDDLTPAKIDALNDPVLTAAYDRFRVEGQGRRVIKVNDENYITTTTPLPGAGRDWWVLMTVPESDFIGFVANNNRTALLMSLGIVFLAAVLAILLVYQGLRADRAARLLLDRSRALNRQSAAYSNLAEQADLFTGDQDQLPPVFTETLAEMTQAHRISIWQLRPESQVLRCLDSFERDSQGHVAGLELHNDELPQFLDAIRSGDEINVSDAAADRRTAQFHRTLMHPLGSRGLLVVPMRSQGTISGAICVEDAAQIDGTREFVRTVASMLALRLVSMRERTVAREASSEAAAQPRTMSERSFSVDLVARALDTPALAATVYSNSAVMVLRLPDQAALANRAAADGPALADTIACTLQSMAEQHAIPYLKLVGDEAVAAAGFEQGDQTAMTRIASMAVAMRDRCSALLEDAEMTADFRIGIDCGLAIGSTVGREPRLFNLWGEAVRTADMMASSAIPSTIQVTEAAYQRLQQDFLFRPRGSFYLPYIGEARTFVLAGQL
ncbi:adenylate/guanylate cyclase domain-containing protein [Dongia soli]|uniref:Adenylate/guanylate cyclase domain-containing protein n=1 Tax=Dongia soli TaxID=600628 RepID=A0ABU5EGH8_9PROT|nr:adenylate/guanylate cyclase domain-containing protein [Dongia soli]MDY0885357.1 adenylate/guanylate cyclase domain-containing protein [Dongia soli]